MTHRLLIDLESGAELSLPDKRAKSGHSRTAAGQNPAKPDRIRTESGQNATMLYGTASFSKECKGAFFPQFSTYRPRPLGKSTIASGRVKTLKNPKKMRVTRERSRTEPQFHSSWWFAGWRSSYGETAPICFPEFCSCMARHLSRLRGAVQDIEFGCGNNL